MSVGTHGATHDRAHAPPGALRLLAEVAHDIRSPLTSILFLVESMHAGHAGPVTREQAHQLALVYTTTFQLNMLVNDLTELAYGSGLHLLRRERVRFAISDVLGSVRDLVQPMVEDRRLELRVENGASEWHLGHPAALTRVLLNLCTNALRVTQHGHVAIGVCERPRACVEFSVSDTGPGIAPEAMARLFEPFTTRGRQRRGLSSAGLGLAISRRLVNAMGSELVVSSTVGVGTRFHFELRLPRARAGVEMRACDEGNDGYEEGGAAISP